MFKFIKRTFLFIALTIGLLVLIDFSTASIERQYADFKIESQPKYIVVGHSYPECAYNDSLITDFVNFSDSGDSYFYTYLKTKELIKQNPSIEIVFIEFSNNQIIEEMNDWIWGDIYMSRGYAMYGSFMSGSDKFTLFKNNNSDYFNALSVSVRKRIIRIIKKDFNFKNRIGGYLPLKRVLPIKSIKDLDVPKPDAILKDYVISDDNLMYLDKLIGFCKSRNKRVILIRSPLHEKYSNYGNEGLFKDILNRRYGKLDFLDFIKFPVSNSGFGDLAHLNYKGAKVYSIWFNKLLVNGLLEKADMQDYINQSIKSEKVSN